MEKFKEIAFSKIPIIVLLILVQVVWFFLFFEKLRKHYAWVGTFFALLSIIMFLAIIMSDQNPSYKISWIVIIGLVPLLGGLLYLVFGNKRPSARLRKKINKSKRNLADYYFQDQKILEKLPDRKRTTSNYILNTGGYPVYDNTSVKYFKVGEQMYASMLEDLKKAKSFIFFEYFIVAESSMWEGIKEILLQKAEEGLEIRVMYDDMGCMGVLPKNLKKDLTAAGIKVMAFNPLVPFMSLVMNNRDHRKILVIDGDIGYTGGINIADEYINVNPPYGHWKDTGIKLQGEAVNNLTAMFLSIWNAYDSEELESERYICSGLIEENSEYKGFVQPFSDSPLDNETLSENIYMDIIWQAKDYVYIFTPYLIIDNEMTIALSMAAKRGVDVRIVVPGIPDKKIIYQLTQSYFKPLMRAGVKIYLYTPGFIHAKSYISDDEIAVVGTINMDYRSLYLHFECGVLMMDTPCIKDIKKDYFEVFEESKLLELDDLKQGRMEDLLRATLRVVSPLL
ncbi:MAG: cardiolipin synthase [Tissierellia bacterium]|nr:cardiolipin synthase [Tissierellia bacterium]